MSKLVKRTLFKLAVMVGLCISVWVGQHLTTFHEDGAHGWYLALGEDADKTLAAEYADGHASLWLCSERAE